MRILSIIFYIFEEDSLKFMRLGGNKDASRLKNDDQKDKNRRYFQTV